MVAACKTTLNGKLHDVALLWGTPASTGQRGCRDPCDLSEAATPLLQPLSVREFYSESNKAAGAGAGASNFYMDGHLKYQRMKRM